MDEQLDRELIRAGGFLHDVSKTESIIAREKQEAGLTVKRVPHDVLGGLVLRARGMPEALAHVVEAHGQVYVDEFDPNGPLTEAELVCYADKRVTGITVVTLEARHAGLFYFCFSYCSCLHTLSVFISCFTCFFFRSCCKI